MAVNKAAGDNARKGAVKKRTEEPADEDFTGKRFSQAGEMTPA